MAVGKSTVAGMFHEYGYRIFDCDHIARIMVDPGQVHWARVLEDFDLSYLNPEGSINRRRLGETVFNDPDKLDLLNLLLHPPLYQKVDKLIKDATDNTPCIIDAAVLIESGMWKLCDHICLVHADRNTQIDRLMARNKLSWEDAVGRLDAQKPIDHIRRFSDYVIDTGQDLAFVRKQLDLIIADTEIGG